MKLSCPSCSAPIAAPSVNLELALAKCDACHDVFSFAEQLGVDPSAALTRPVGAPPAAPPAPVSVRDVPQPRGVEATQDGDQLVLRYRWFHPTYLGLLLFCVFWDGFLVFWYGIALTSGAGAEMFVGPLLHVAVGLGLSWYVLAGLVNRTTVTVSRGRISVAHGPVPWPGAKKLDAAEVAQLWFEQKVSTSSKGSRSVRYHLHALLTDGVSVKLVGGLHEPAYARYLEYRLEEHLGLTDRPVDGEYRG